MESEQEPEIRDEVAAQERRAELAEIRSPFLSMVRYLRAARRQNPETLLQLIEQMHLSLTELLDNRGLIEIGLAAAHFRHGKDDVLDYSPMDDPALFSLFQAGVRQMSFHPGLSLQELKGFLEVVAEDLDDEENAEEDLSTLLESKELEAIQLVVIETFFESESERAEGDHRMDDVQALIQAATRESLSVDSEDGVGGGTIRLFDADAEFFRGDDLPELLAALNKVGGDENGGGLAEDDEIVEFGVALQDGLARCVDELPTPALAVLDTVTGRDAERIAAVLAREVNASARRNGIESVARGLDVIDDWLLAQPRGDRRSQLTERVFTRELRMLAFDDLSAGSHKAALARRILSQTPESGLPRAVRDAAKMEFGEARQQAFGALLGASPQGFALAAKLLESEPDADLAVDVLTPFARMPLSSGTLTLFRAGLVYDEPEVKLRALSWFVHFGGDHAVGSLGDALRSSVPAIRLGALLLLVERRADVARTILKIWFDSDDFSKLTFDGRRRVMLVLARRMGDRLAPELREQAKQGNLLRRQAIDEDRALAMAGLGLLVDEEVLALAEKYERSPFSGEALKSECSQIRAAFQRGDAPYEDPLPVCYDELRDLALLEAVLASEPLAGGMTALHSPGTKLAAGIVVGRAVAARTSGTQVVAPPVVVPAAAPETAPEPASPAARVSTPTSSGASASAPEPPRASAEPAASEAAPTDDVGAVDHGLDDIGIDIEGFEDGSEPLELASHSYAESAKSPPDSDLDESAPLSEVVPLTEDWQRELEPDPDPVAGEAASAVPAMVSFGKPVDGRPQRVSVVPAARAASLPSDEPRPAPVATVRPPGRNRHRSEPGPTVRPPALRAAEASQAEASQAEASQAEASQAEASQAEASQAEASQAEASQAEASQAEASQTVRPPSRATKLDSEAEAMDDDLKDLMSHFSFELEDPTGPGGTS